MPEVAINTKKGSVDQVVVSRRGKANVPKVTIMTEHVKVKQARPSVLKESPPGARRQEKCSLIVMN